VKIPEHVVEFIADLERYYGQYRPAVKAMIVEWLAGIGKPWPTQELLDYLYDGITNVFSTRWRTPPSKADLREFLRDWPFPSETVGVPELAALVARVCAREETQGSEGNGRIIVGNAKNEG
jgi:hypothetical protein